MYKQIHQHQHQMYTNHRQQQQQQQQQQQGNNKKPHRRPLRQSQIKFNMQNTYQSLYTKGNEDCVRKRKRLSPISKHSMFFSF